MTIEECARHPYFAQCAAQLAAQAHAKAMAAAPVPQRAAPVPHESSPTCSSASAASHLHVAAPAPLLPPGLLALPACRLSSATDRQSGRHKAARVQSPPHEVRTAPAPLASVRHLHHPALVHYGAACRYSGCLRWRGQRLRSRRACMRPTQPRWRRTGHSRPPLTRRVAAAASTAAARAARA